MQSFVLPDLPFICLLKQRGKHLEERFIRVLFYLGLFPIALTQQLQAFASQLFYRGHKVFFQHKLQLAFQHAYASVASFCLQ